MKTVGVVKLKLFVPAPLTHMPRLYQQLMLSSFKGGGAGVHNAWPASTPRYPRVRRREAGRCAHG